MRVFMALDAVVQFVERRREKRTTVGRYLLQIDACDGRKPIQCSVRDISMNGASLKLSENAELPAEVTILIGNVTRRARIAWRKWDQIGIEFLAEPDFPPE